MKTSIEILKDKLIKRRNTLKITKDKTIDIKSKVTLGIKIRELATIIEMVSSMIRKEQKNTIEKTKDIITINGIDWNTNLSEIDEEENERIDFEESDYDINPDFGDK